MNPELRKKIKQNSRLIGMILLCLIFWMLTIYFRYKYSELKDNMYFTATVTFLTFAYHFSMRILMGIIITVIFRKRDFPSYWKSLVPSEKEQILYKKWNVKAWKKYAITANPSQFALHSLSLKEILHNMKQAELVHICIVICSFIPLIFAIPFGALPVFAVTSIVAACIDLKYIIIQRYNIPRVIKLVEVAKEK